MGSAEGGSPVDTVTKDFFNRVTQVALNAKYPVYAVLMEDFMVHLHPLESINGAPSWSKNMESPCRSLSWASDETILLVERGDGYVEALSIVEGESLYRGKGIDVSHIGQDWMCKSLLVLHQEPSCVVLEFHLGDGSSPVRTTFDGYEYAGLQHGEFLLLRDLQGKTSSLFRVKLRYGNKSASSLECYKKARSALATMSREMHALRRCRRDLTMDVGDFGEEGLKRMYVFADADLFKSFLEIIATMPLRAIEGRERPLFIKLSKLVESITHRSLISFTQEISEGLAQHRQEWDKLVKLIRSIRDFSAQSELSVKEWQSQCTSTQFAEFLSLLSKGDTFLLKAQKCAQEALDALHCQITLHSECILTVPYSCSSFAFIPQEEMLLFTAKEQHTVGWLSQGNLIARELGRRNVTVCYKNRDIWAFDRETRELHIYSVTAPDPIVAPLSIRPADCLLFSPRAILSLSRDHQCVSIVYTNS